MGASLAPGRGPPPSPTGAATAAPRGGRRSGVEFLCGAARTFPGGRRPTRWRTSMDEVEWLACNEPWRMLENLVGASADPAGRPMRLFACGCARIAWAALDEQRRAAVEVAERYADGDATDRDLFYCF